MRWREILVFVLFLGGATLFTYPLARDIRTAAKDHYDPLLDAWVLSWVAHQLPRDPVHLFDSDRFYPESGTLAFNDPMVGLGILMAPVEWLTWHLAESTRRCIEAPPSHPTIRLAGGRPCA